MQFSSFKLPKKLPTLSFPASPQVDDDGSTGTSLLRGGDSQASKTSISLPKMFSSGAASTPSPSGETGSSPFNIFSSISGSSGAASSTARSGDATRESRSGFMLLSGSSGGGGSSGGSGSNTNLSVKDKMKNAAMSAAEEHGMDPNAAEAAMTFNSPPPFPCCEGMSKKERIIGFLVCFGLGAFFNILALSSWSSILLGKPVKFGFLYSSGNLCCFGATFFLIGPRRQFKTMTKKSRRVSVAIYLSVILLTFICIFIPWASYNMGLVGAGVITLLVFVQIGAGFWYTLSYIPYGRAAALKIVLKAKKKGEKMISGS
mmetsp:Transcript_32217/g.75667  ORF Transcript_32217/g.75667 Transcript_32217/m.75667 type:complete len:316 (+) Transcript_32217:58-1005(+)